MKLRTRGLRPLALQAVAFAAVAFGATITIDPKLYLDDVKYLASPELRGRLTGSPELEKAAGYLRAKYELLGLQPVGGSFEQSFPATTDAKLGPANKFSFTENGRSVTLGSGDFVPFNFSQTGKLSGA